MSDHPPPRISLALNPGYGATRYTLDPDYAFSGQARRGTSKALPRRRKSR